MKELSYHPEILWLSIYLFQVLYPDIKINDWRRLRPMYLGILLVQSVSILAPWLISAQKDTIKNLSRHVWMFLTKIDTT